MADNVVNSVHHFKLDLGGAEGALLFSKCETPNGTLEALDFKTFDANGNPVNSVGGGSQVTWRPITISRGVDHNTALYDWFKQVREGGATSDTKKEIKLTACDAQGTDIQTWSLTGAIITSYGDSGANAQTNEILVETVQIKYEDATLEAA